jgi:hypothetical protein
MNGPTRQPSDPLGRTNGAAREPSHSFGRTNGATWRPSRSVGPPNVATTQQSHAFGRATGAIIDNLEQQSPASGLFASAFGLLIFANAPPTCAHRQLVRQSAPLAPRGALLKPGREGVGPPDHSCGPVDGFFGRRAEIGPGRDRDRAEAAIAHPLFTYA